MIMEQFHILVVEGTEMTHGIKLYMLLTGAQLCLTLCNPIDYSLPGSSAHRIFSRQEYWNGLPFPTLGDLPNPGLKPASLASPVLLGSFFTTDLPGKMELYMLFQVFSHCRRMCPGLCLTP